MLPHFGRRGGSVCAAVRGGEGLSKNNKRIIQEATSWTTVELRRAKLDIARRERYRVPTSRSDPAFDALLGELADIRVDFFGAAPGVSVGKTMSQHEGEPAGPLFRFVRAVLVELAQINDAVRPRNEKAGKLLKCSDDALRHHIRSAVSKD